MEEVATGCVLFPFPELSYNQNFSAAGPSPHPLGDIPSITPPSQKVALITQGPGPCDWLTDGQARGGLLKETLFLDLSLKCP